MATGSGRTQFLRLLVVTVALSGATGFAVAHEQGEHTNAAALTAIQSGNAEEARKIWLHLAEEGDAVAQSNMGGLLLSGALGQPDYKGALEWFTKAAAQNNPSALVSLGHLYSAGLPGLLTADKVQSIDYFRRAADLGNAEGAYFYGDLTLQSGSPTTEAAGAQSILKAAEAGFPPAMNRVGTFFQTGAYVERDLSKAIEWYEGASKAGYSESTYLLGEIAMNGDSGTVNMPEALEKFEAAAAKDNINGLRAAAFILLKGLAGPADPEKAAKLFQRGAELWDYRAMYYLGTQYFDGLGVGKDLVEAHKWFDLAAAGGHVEAHYMRGAAAAGLTAEQIKHSDEMAQQWFDANHSTPHTHESLEPHAH